MGSIDTRWFDEKVKRGVKPSLEDKSELVNQLQIPLTDRAKGKVKDYIREVMFELRRSYRPGMEVLAHLLLFSPLAISCLETNEYRDYVREYRDILEKHQDKAKFERNFE